MVRTCSSCGVVTAPEARFCRHCGAPLRVAGNVSDNKPISPLAQTVPLSGEGLTTSGLGAEDAAGGTGAETKRVGRTEMDQLLRRSRLEVTTGGKADGHHSLAPDPDYAAPPTGELVPTPHAPSSAVHAPAQSIGNTTIPGARARRSWRLITGLLLLVAISGAALAYYFLRHRTTDSASNAPSVSNSNQPAESSNTNSPAGETSVNAAGPQQEEKPPAQETLRAEDGTPQQASQPTPKPSASVELTREARARQERSERATDAPAPANSPTPLPAPTGSPVAQATPGQTPAPSPAANSNNSGTPPSQANSDAFYFQAVNVLNGRDPRALKRAELLRALQYFQNVKSGPHVEEARRQAQRLGRELDRQNKQSQR